MRWVQNLLGLGITKIHKEMTMKNENKSDSKTQWWRYRLFKETINPNDPASFHFDKAVNISVNDPSKDEMVAINSHIFNQK